MRLTTRAKFSVRSLTIAVSWFLASTALGSQSPAVAAEPRDADRYIVVLHDDVDDPRTVANEHARDHGARVNLVHRFALRGYTAEIPAAEVRRLRTDRRVRSVERDQLVSGFGQLIPTGLDRTAEPEKVGVVSAHLTVDSLDDRRVDADVAILDTGVNADHGDLNVVQITDCTQGCLNGVGEDGAGHGTHVAGTAGAVDNDFGVVGVAPGARLWSVKVLGDDASGYISWIVAGVDWVTARADQIEVANMSLGCRCTSSALDAAISGSVAAGVTYTVAAGNNSADASEFSPARHPDVIAVSAISDFDGWSGGLGTPSCVSDVDDTLAPNSNFGSVIDIAAPGTCIVSTSRDGAYRASSGTSMASPHVAGAAALLASQPAYRGRPAQIRDAIIAAGNQGWTDDSVDGVTEPLLDISPFEPVSVAAAVPAALSVNDVSVLEGGPVATATATFTLTLSAAPPPGQAVSVRVTTADGSATAGSDYTAMAPSTITFGPGETTAAVPVAVNGDVWGEPNETFVLNLSSPVGAVIADAQGVATVVDEEGPLRVSVDDVSVLEGDPGDTATARFTLSLSGAPAVGETVSLQVSTGNRSAKAASDYTAVAPTTVSFGVLETSKTLAVAIRGDSVAEGNETFVLKLSSPVGAVIADDEGLATIVNDDGSRGVAPPRAVSVSDLWILEGAAGATTTATFRLSLSAAPALGETVSVRVATGNRSATAGSDYTAVPDTTVSFRPFQTSETVRVGILGDSRAEGNETFVLKLASPIGAVIADYEGVGTVVDEEGPLTLSVGDVSVQEGGPGASATASFTVAVSASPDAGQTVSVHVVTADGQSGIAGWDYTALPSTIVTFRPGERTKAVQVAVAGDSLAEANETFVLNLSSPVGASIADGQGVATIINDD
jgi:hypothetical protein